MANESRDDSVDEMEEETFPASDPPSGTVETGIRIGPPAATGSDVQDNRDASQFQLTVDGKTAFLVYERTANRLVLVHTEVPEELRGRHLGDRLVEAALAAARRDHLQVVAECPFARKYLQKHK